MNTFKTLLTASFTALMFVGCVTEDDTELPDYLPLLLSEEFEVGDDNTLLTTQNWQNLSVAGDAYWKIQRFSNNGYAEFSGFGSGDASNIGWLISPPIMLDQNNGKKLKFQSAQSYVDNAANTLEVLISTNYNGTNIATANWTNLNAILPGLDADFFAFIDSGEINLSQYSGTVYIAFKVTGSGTALDGSYQIDNVIVY